MASESASTTTGAGSTSAPTIREIIPTNRTPEVWKDFNMCIMTNGQKKDQCKRSRIRIRKSEATSMERWANFHGSIRLSSRTIRGVGDFNGVPFNTLTRADNEGVPKSLWQPRYHHDYLIENISRAWMLKMMVLQLGSLRRSLSGEQRRDYMMSSGAEDDQTGEGGSMSHGYTYY
ncbi:hypothetical protein Tco_0996965 [Tanacetum coccineum]